MKTQLSLQVTFDFWHVLRSSWKEVHRFSQTPWVWISEGVLWNLQEAATQHGHPQQVRKDTSLSRLSLEAAIHSIERPLATFLPVVAWSQSVKAVAMLLDVRTFHLNTPRPCRRCALLNASWQKSHVSWSTADEITPLDQFYKKQFRVTQGRHRSHLIPLAALRLLTEAHTINFASAILAFVLLETRRKQVNALEYPADLWRLQVCAIHGQKTRLPHALTVLVDNTHLTMRTIHQVIIGFTEVAVIVFA